MNQSFYTGALGAQQQMQRMNVQGNNIANVNSYGYKAQASRFGSLMYQNMRGIENPQVPYGTGARMEMTATKFQCGGAAATGLAQDYMIEGDGFFALVDIQTGEISLTRNGSFTVSELMQPAQELDAAGQDMMQGAYYLSDGAGHFVLGTTGAMIKVEDPTAKQAVGVFDFINYDGMEHQDGTRFLSVEKNGNLRRAGGTIVQGMLELSNVDLAQEMTKVIEAQRAYGMALKMVQTSDEVETTINSLRA